MPGHDLVTVDGTRINENDNPCKKSVNEILLQAKKTYYSNILKKGENVEYQP